MIGAIKKTLKKIENKALSEHDAIDNNYVHG